jgi:hypothetical protein
MRSNRKQPHNGQPARGGTPDDRQLPLFSAEEMTALNVPPASDGAATGKKTVPAAKASNSNPAGRAKATTTKTPQIVVVKTANIQFHPTIQTIIQGQRPLGLPSLPPDFLKPDGISQLIEMLPIRVIRYRDHYRCFAGSSTLDAVRHATVPIPKVQVVLYADVTSTQIKQAILFELVMLTLIGRVAAKKMPGCIKRILRAARSAEGAQLIQPLTKADWARVLKCSERSFKMP